MSIFDELSVEFRDVYSVLADIDSINYLDDFKSTKQEIKDLRKYNVLMNNLLKMSYQHNKDVLKSEFDELKEQYKNDLKLKIDTKEALLKDLISRTYEKFEEYNNIDLKFDSSKQHFDFSKKAISKRYVSNNNPNDTSKEKVAFGDFTRQCFLNVQGKSREHLSKKFEDLFNQKVIDKLSEKMSGRLFNLYSLANKGLLEDQKRGLGIEREVKFGKVQLCNYDYKDAYKELRDFKKLLKDYVPTSKLDDLINTIKKDSKAIFKKYTVEKDRVREIEQENEALKKEIEALKKAQGSKDVKKGTPKAQESTKEPKGEQDTTKDTKEVLSTPKEPKKSKIAETLEKNRAKIKEIEKKAQEPKKEESKKVFVLDVDVNETMKKFKNIPKGYFLKVDVLVKQFKAEEKEFWDERDKERNRKRENELFRRRLSSTTEPKEAQEKKELPKISDDNKAKIRETLEKNRAKLKEIEAKKAQEKKAQEEKDNKDKNNDFDRNRKR